jgi:hypothetical protein
MRRPKIAPPNRAVTAAFVLSQLHRERGAPLTVVAASSEDETSIARAAVRRRTTHRLTEEPTTSRPTSRRPSSSSPSSLEPSTSLPTLLSFTETISLKEDTTKSTFLESVTTEFLPPPTKVPSPRLSEKPLPTEEPTPQVTSSFRLRLYWEKGYRWQNKREELWYCTGMF